MSGVNNLNTMTSVSSDKKIGNQSTTKSMAIRLGEQIEENIRNKYFKKNYREDDTIDKMRTMLRRSLNKFRNQVQKKDQGIL